MVITEAGLYGRIGGLLPPEFSDSIFILTDSRVGALYLEQLVDQLRDGGSGVHTYVIVPGEVSKSIRQLESLLAWLLDMGANRRSLLINLGGGVVSDLGGLAAALFMRGMPYVNIPTSVIGQIDAAVGGKTAVNYGGVKNLIGCFRQPEQVLTDPELLSTLDDREWAVGCGEVLKYAVLAGQPSWSGRFRRGSADVSRIIADCLEWKLAVSGRDPFDRGERRTLNLGHTLGHALESLCGLPHGAAVAYGLIGAAELAARLGYTRADFPADIRARVVAIPDLTPFPIGADPDEITEHILTDKKRQEADSTVWILPRNWGSVTVESLPNRIWMPLIRDFLKQESKGAMNHED